MMSDSPCVRGNCSTPEMGEISLTSNPRSKARQFSERGRFIFFATIYYQRGRNVKYAVASTLPVCLGDKSTVTGFRKRLMHSTRSRCCLSRFHQSACNLYDCSIISITRSISDVCSMNSSTSPFPQRPRPVTSRHIPFGSYTSENFMFTEIRSRCF